LFSLRLNYDSILKFIRNDNAWNKLSIQNKVLLIERFAESFVCTSDTIEKIRSKFQDYLFILRKCFEDKKLLENMIDKMNVVCLKSQNGSYSDKRFIRTYELTLSNQQTEIAHNPNELKGILQKINDNDENDLSLICDIVMSNILVYEIECAFHRFHSRIADYPEYNELFINFILELKASIKKEHSDKLSNFVQELTENESLKKRIISYLKQYGGHDKYLPQAFKDKGFNSADDIRKVIFAEQRGAPRLE